MRSCSAHALVGGRHCRGEQTIRRGKKGFLNIVWDWCLKKLGTAESAVTQKVSFKILFCTLKLTKSSCVAHKSDCIDWRSHSLTKCMLSARSFSCHDAGGDLQSVGATEHCQSAVMLSGNRLELCSVAAEQLIFKPLLPIPFWQKQGH